MELYPRVPLEPLPHLGGFVRGVVVDDHMDVKARLDTPFDLPHEAEKLLMTVARQAVMDHLPGGYIQRREQGRCVVALAGESTT